MRSGRSRWSSCSGLPGTANAHERERLLGMLMTLHEVAASVAQVDVANRLAELRASDEERRHSIRQSAVNTSMYDLTIQVATQQPALYSTGASFVELEIKRHKLIPENARACAERGPYEWHNRGRRETGQQGPLSSWQYVQAQIDLRAAETAEHGVQAVCQKSSSTS